MEVLTEEEGLHVDTYLPAKLSDLGLKLSNVSVELCWGDSFPFSILAVFQAFCPLGSIPNCLLETSSP